MPLGNAQNAQLLNDETTMQEGEIDQSRMFAHSRRPDEYDGQQGGSSSPKLKSILQRASQDEHDERRGEGASEIQHEILRLNACERTTATGALPTGTSASRRLGQALLEDDAMQRIRSMSRVENTGFGVRSDTSLAEKRVASLQRENTALRMRLEASFEENALLLAETQQELDRNHLLPMAIDRLQQRYGALSWNPVSLVPSGNDSMGYESLLASSLTLPSARAMIHNDASRTVQCLLGGEATPY